MIKFFAFYDADGDVTSVASGDGGVTFSYPGCTTIEVNEETYRRLRTGGSYLQHGEFVKRPPMPSVYHEWNKKTKQWVLNAAKQQVFAAEEVRAQRDQLLLDSDWTDTLSAKGRLGSRYDDWQQYRQALRDITSQPGFPTTVVWPTPPG